MDPTVTLPAPRAPMRAELPQRLRTDEARTYEANRDYILRVLARRFAWLDPAEREAILHDAFVVMLVKQRRRDLDPDAMTPQQLRAFLARTAIYKALAKGRRAEVRSAAPFGDELLASLPDPGPGPDERAEASQRRASVHEAIGILPAREQALIGLRLLLECSPAEVQDHLGLTPRTYRRLLERAKARIRAHVGAIDHGLG